MGNYTECIIGCELDLSTPADVIETLQWLTLPLIPRLEVPRPVTPWERDSRIDWMMSGGSAYFPVTAQSSLTRSNYAEDGWVLSARFNIKNYSGEIETFLEWLRPWVYSGSGEEDIFAIVIREDQVGVTLFTK